MPPRGKAVGADGRQVQSNMVTPCLPVDDDYAANVRGYKVLHAEITLNRLCTLCNAMSFGRRWRIAILTSLAGRSYRPP